MNASLKLGQIWGIPIQLHWSLLLVFGLLAWSLAAGYFPAEYPTLTLPTYWLLAVMTSLLFFGSVLLHELGHAYLALRYKIPVQGITLFIFGGVAELKEEARTPGAEFRIAIAGPLVSLALAGIFGSLWLLDQQIPLLAAPSIWLARINLILALFNLIPGFPLDGGRVLRAAIWHLSGNGQRATQLAAFSGQLIAFGFMGVGFFIALTGNFFNGLWLAFIGWFLQNAAASSIAQVNLQQSLQGVTVRQVMAVRPRLIPGTLSLNQLVEENVLSGAGERTFLVGEADRPRGLLAVHDLAAVPQRKWRYVTVEQVMTPLKAVIQVQPDTDVNKALELLSQANLSQLIVAENDRIVGILSREQISGYLRLRFELGLNGNPNGKIGQEPETA